jgi:hypothetical protein
MIDVIIYILFMKSDEFSASETELFFVLMVHDGFEGCS